MKLSKILLPAILAGICSTTYADQPPGIGSAEIVDGKCYGRIVVGPDGDHVPFLLGGLGLIQIELGDAKTVRTNSAQGNLHLSCHGDVSPGDVVLGWDALQNAWVYATVATRSDSCAAIVDFGLENPCRGKGEKSAVIDGPELQGFACFVDGVPTYNWKSVFNEGGFNLSCHAYQ